MQYQILKMVETWARSRAQDPSNNGSFRTALVALADAAAEVARYH